MSQHNYGAQAIESIDGALSGAASGIANTVYTCESMSYAWDAGLLDAAVSWFEVQQLIAGKDMLGMFFKDARKLFSNCVTGMGEADQTAASRLEGAMIPLQACKDRLLALLSCTEENVSNPGGMGDISRTLENVSNLGAVGLNSESNNSKTVKLSGNSQKNPFSQNIPIPNKSTSNKTRTYRDKLNQKKYSIRLPGNGNVDVTLSDREILTVISLILSGFMNQMDEWSDLWDIGEAQLYTGKIELVDLPDCHAYIELKNCLESDYHDCVEKMKKEVTSFSIDGKGSINVKDDGSLDYSYEKILSGNSKMTVSISYNPFTGVAKAKYLIKVMDSKDNSEHSIAYVCEKECIKAVEKSALDLKLSRDVSKCLLDASIKIMESNPELVYSIVEDTIASQFAISSSAIQNILRECSDAMSDLEKAASSKDFIAAMGALAVILACCASASALVLV